MNWIFKILGIQITRFSFKNKERETEERMTSRGRGRGQDATVRGNKGHLPVMWEI